MGRCVSLGLGFEVRSLNYASKFYVCAPGLGSPSENLTGNITPKLGYIELYNPSPKMGVQAGGCSQDLLKNAGLTFLPSQAQSCHRTRPTCLEGV